MGVPGVYGVNVWFKSLRYFAHMHPKNISNMYVKVYSRKWRTSLGNVFFFGCCGCLENCASEFFGYTG